MNLIDRDALADALFEQRKNYPQWVADEIGNAPVVDAVQIVRCKNCKKRESWECWQYFLGRIKIPDDWFCADGEMEE